MSMTTEKTDQGTAEAAPRPRQAPVPALPKQPGGGGCCPASAVWRGNRVAGQRVGGNIKIPPPWHPGQCVTQDRRACRNSWGDSQLAGCPSSDLCRRGNGLALLRGTPGQDDLPPVSCRARISQDAVHLDRATRSADTFLGNLDRLDRLPGDHKPQLQVKSKDGLRQPPLRHARDPLLALLCIAVIATLLRLQFFSTPGLRAGRLDPSQDAPTHSRLPEGHPPKTPVPDGYLLPQPSRT